MAERKANGQFAPGHKPANNGKGGRPARSTEERFIGILRDTVKPEDWATIVLTAIARARAGDYQARQWLSDWLMGKPVQKIAPTDPTGEFEYGGLSDAELLARATAIVDAQRAGGPGEDTDDLEAGCQTEPTSAGR